MLSQVSNPQSLQKWKCHVTKTIFKLRPNFSTANIKQFPTFEVLENCIKPLVSSDSILLDLPCLWEGWWRTFFQSEDLIERYRFLLQSFYGHGHDARVWPAEKLAVLELLYHPENACTESIGKHGCQKVKTRKSKYNPDPESSPVAAITLDPRLFLSEEQISQIRELHRGTWTTFAREELMFYDKGLEPAELNTLTRSRVDEHMDANPLVFKRIQTTVLKCVLDEPSISRCFVDKTDTLPAPKSSLKKKKSEAVMPAPALREHTNTTGWQGASSGPSSSKRSKITRLGSSELPFDLTENENVEPDRGESDDTAEFVDLT
ncbi:hypothetical protein K402DRAFT_418137 [Aulographum hederae CBS 113979]|uniref:Uncharacterized protein n=1 Tax=Aulographum hederae CBS 113979 TaxID=1176131 RepID=A0A6G1H9Z2_9PEZI|nr:hypothetical protein K402DRAFT_418137 [Aulographum hederae CBS 113979]